MRELEKNKIKVRNGTVLAYMLIIMTIVSILLVSILQYVTSQMRYGFYNYDKEEAFQIAESGMNFYKWYLAKEMETRTTPQDILDYWNGTPIGTDYDCDEADAYIVDYESGDIRGKYCIEVDPPDEWSTVFTVRSVGWTDANPNAKRTVQARFRRPSFSEYMLVGDKQFVLNDQAVVHGRLHSNEGVHFNGVAYNTVSSEQDTYYYSDSVISAGQWGWKDGVWTYWPSEYNNTLHADVFQAGKQVGISEGATHWDFPSIDPYISFAKTKSLEGVSPPGTPCDSDGCYFDNTGEGRKLTLNGDNFSVCDVNSYCNNCKTENYTIAGITFTVNWGCCKGSWFGVVCWGLNYCNRYSILNYKRTDGTSGTCTSCSSQCAARGPYAIPNNGVIYVEDNAWVGGTVGTSSNHKRVSIVAADTSQSPGSSIFVGENNLTYSSYDGSDTLGLLGQNNVEIVKNSQNDLRLDGALLARNGRVGRDYYYDSPNSVTFYGSIITNGKFNVGKAIIPTWDYGYQNAYLNFDNNLLYHPPPFFPTGVGYSLDSWEEL